MGIQVFLFSGIKNYALEAGVVAHACNPSTWDAEQDDHKFETSLSYVMRPCHKTNYLKVAKLKRDSGIALEN
jgi:hypothetical protein